MARQAPADRKWILGVVGGIGSGKSLVARQLGELGGYVIEADRLGHEALRQPAIRDQVFARWGDRVRDSSGEVDRRLLARIVFQDEQERKALEGMVFPYIGRRIREEIDKSSRDPRYPFIVLDAAIMLETGWGDACDRILFVEAPRQERLRRLLAQRGWSEEEVRARESAQLKVEAKAARADHVLDNSGDEVRTRRQVEDVLRQLPGFQHQGKEQKAMA